MASADAPEMSLLSLEDELSCSICLSLFDCPVTIPCGHNFCQDCLLSTWKDSYSCPQCRTVFATRPELKKNTVLSTVVETLRARSGWSEAEAQAKPQKKVEMIRCDMCMEAEASQTCLTCMASYCEEHLRPHRDNPVFRLHQLSRPVGDLLERICPDHNKLMELFCSQHDRSICSLCLQQDHKGCSFTSQEEQRSLKESNLKDKLKFLDGKISKTEGVLLQMKDMQNTLKDSAASRKKILSSNYQQMRDLLVQEERDALSAVDREVETGLSKIKILSKKFMENVDSMHKARDDIQSLLAQSQTMNFLKTSFKIPQAAGFDPYAPRINLDSKKVILSQSFAPALKEHLTELLKQPLEARLPIISPEPQYQSKQQKADWSKSPASQTTCGQKKKVSSKQSSKLETEGDSGMGARRSSMDNLLEFSLKDKTTRQNAAAEARGKPDEAEVPVCFSSGEKRSELLKYGTVLTFDPKTAHRRIVLSEGFTVASVSDEHTNYPDSPRRFTVCSQVLAAKAFSQGRHYWEVRLSGNNFVGIGLAYGSIDRKGPASRLGRNAQSWCVEWFNVKLSAWHNSSETVLFNPGPKRVGVLLDCEGGTATFYNVTDRAYPFHVFTFPFAEAVHPAFWIFSSGSSVSLCKLQA
ncbi:E3 ubiquitin/ISG15 ligase TRIM25-like isoform X3 [Salarias fasciatus]|uniref:E3 ubiquitin/ISG15 ligase TRIM25-like isoform X3 n=1 Tax=Salarias fasciatus TaxID=181472 RepID=UPI00117653D5|nr:E3 ubiquitin/ISG15 ligase TRIM25-like isoform X3 [Salarias fasciatus]